MITITLPEWIGWLLLVIVLLQCVQIVMDTMLQRLYKEHNRLLRKQCELQEPEIRVDHRSSKPPRW